MTLPHLRIWFVGQCPPPMSGQTVFNARMRRCLESAGEVVELPLGGTAGAKLWRALVTPVRLIFGLRRGDIVYTSPPGQAGIWLFLLTVLALRLRGVRFYVHHHSYRAIALGPLPPVRMLGRIAGGLATHVLLCERMRDAYEALYRTSPRERFLCLPNAAFFSGTGTAPPAPREGPVTVGHMSVMTREKGVPYLLDLWRRVADRAPGARLVLAGPVHDPALRAEVETAVREGGGRVAWLGPVSGREKRAFLETVDLFVLPTQLVDEADPLVLLEAYSAGAAVLAPDRGCIRSRLVSPDWLMSMDAAQDVELLATRIAETGRARAELPGRLVAHAQDLRTQAEDRALAFLAEFGLSADDARAALARVRA
ncbi:glycosyltransferase family 4 protein [Celeribacter indicus]|uniref:Putative Glycosyl transferase, group 1 n=1 Tax=Celeribacter indicus TaxID=1208324 RepID=A0A0B5DXE2_9RHOB|nr:glycosyltransferase family 4 protein [Celeribacter indicus]AJE45426.1 putative Glycosyl transferase, group 1 [Celeribacter indicus]SDX01695.1 Glycosyltransferase involved in cell wall bisynthesis [Celeribacter indicus]